VEVGKAHALEGGGSGRARAGRTVSAVDHEDAAARRLVREQQVLGDDRPERPAADDDDVEWPAVGGWCAEADVYAGALEGLLERVSQVAPHVVERE
jgi:hypothetical protein